MRFKKRLKVEAELKPIDIAPLIDCVFLLLIFFMLTSSFVVTPGISVNLPDARGSRDIAARGITVVVSSEDIVYIDGKPVTLKELETIISKKNTGSVFIKSDRYASLGVVVSIWDLCKQNGIEKIGIGTTNEKRGQATFFEKK